MGAINIYNCWEMKTVKKSRTLTLLCDSYSQESSALHICTYLIWFWCWEGLGARGEGDERGWDGWKASPTQWTEFEWTLGVGDGQVGLACCDSWGRKESDTTEQLNWTDSHLTNEVRWPAVYWAILNENSWLKLLLVTLLINASYIIFYVACFRRLFMLSNV